MTPLALIAMRKAATLAFALPGLNLDIEHDGARVARVERRFAGGEVSVSTTLLSPGAFRGAVGKAAMHARRSGTALFLGLRADAEPRLMYTMPFTGPFAGAARPLGLMVSRVRDTMVHVFATSVPRNEVVALVHSIDPNQLPCGVIVNTSFDPITDITLVYCEERLANLAVTRPRIEALMESLLTSLAAEEVAGIVAELSAATGGWV